MDANPQSYQMISFAGKPFHVPVGYSHVHHVGTGGFSLVCSAVHDANQTNVAIKKVENTFRSEGHCQRIHREVVLLSHLRHPNIIQLYDMYMATNEDVYLITDLFQHDLKTLITNRPLNTPTVCKLLYQIVCGLKYVHSAHVIHRDLKPSNILINSDGRLKICDFGLARVNDDDLSEYVCTRHYRAPEVFLGRGAYSYAMDIWSAGCVGVEMFIGRVFLAGRHHADQMQKIVRFFGLPSNEVLMEMGADSDAITYLRQIQGPPSVSGLGTVLPNAGEEARDVINRMLQFDPQVRISAEGALSHPFFREIRSPANEFNADETVDQYAVEGTYHTIPEWRKLVVEEIQRFKSQLVERQQHHQKGE